MTELIEIVQNQAPNNRFVEIPERIFDKMTPEDAGEAIDKFAGDVLIKLPEREIRFFEWLKKEDPAIWDDLWSGGPDEPYVVSISFLGILADKTRGFPICDLENHDNYYFTPEHMQEEEGKAIIHSARKRFKANKSLSPAQALALEISTDPIDIWRFSYKYGVSLPRAKEAVKELTDDRALIHLTETEHLAGFVDV